MSRYQRMKTQASQQAFACTHACSGQAAAARLIKGEDLDALGSASHLRGGNTIQFEVIDRAAGTPIVGKPAPLTKTWRSRLSTSTARARTFRRSWSLKGLHLTITCSGCRVCRWGGGRAVAALRLHPSAYLHRLPGVCHCTREIGEITAGAGETVGLVRGGGALWVLMHDILSAGSYALACVLLLPWRFSKVLLHESESGGGTPQNRHIVAHGCLSVGSRCRLH